MLYPDVLQLKQFYASKLGTLVANQIAHVTAHLWPSTSGDAVLVIGYGAPYVEVYLVPTTPLMVIMPAQQGAAAWPPAKANHVVLSHEDELPVQNNSINRVLLVHSMEYSENLNGLMQEVWRVLVPGGRVLAVVPNRMSFWSGSGNTPFGFGRPFNVLQLRGLLTGHHFTITRSTSALFTPPFIARLSYRVSEKIEKIGRLLWWFLGGVIIMEAEKQLYASIKEPVLMMNPYRVLRARRAASVSKKTGVTK